jgi:hypothetical protein
MRQRMLMRGRYAPTGLRKGQTFIPYEIAAQCCPHAANGSFRPKEDIKRSLSITLMGSQVMSFALSTAQRKCGTESGSESTAAGEIRLIRSAWRLTMVTPTTLELESDAGMDSLRLIGS